MKTTGIIRRIDELGRIVIPKEIRKTLRLKEGNPLEIMASLDELVMRKYSPLGGLENFGEDIVVALNFQTEKTAILTDTENVICAKGKKSSSFEKEKLSKTLIKKIEDRSSHIFNDGTDEFLVDVCEKKTEDGEEKISGQLIIPIVSGGDVIGSIILLCFDRNCKISELDINTARFAVSILARQFEG